MYAQKDTVSINSKKDSTILKKRVVKSVPNSPSDEPKKRINSKIINDSVKNVYGPKTSMWTTESELFHNKINYQPLDTSIHNYHRWNFVQKHNNLYQDLGNMGTALNPIFPVVSTTIGATAGFRAYAPYFETREPRYYDTKSPYTRIYVVWGGKGRAMTHIEFSRNISPRWNFGFNYRPFIVERQLQYSPKQYQTTSHYYDGYTTYRSKNDNYFLTFNYRRIRHRVKENGGILLSSKDTTYSAFYNPTAKTYLSVVSSPDESTETEELRQAFHLHQQFQFAKPIQVYLTSDYLLQVNTFMMAKLDKSKSFFRKPLIDSARVSDVSQFKSFQNEVGVKGNAAFLFYDFYYKVRSVQNSNRYLSNDPGPWLSAMEHYVGGRMAFRFDSLSELRGQAEYLLDGNYKIDGKFTSPWLDASFVSALTKPGYMQQAYRGTYNEWSGNNLSTIFSNQIKGKLKLTTGRLFVSPGVTYTGLNNYIFFEGTTKNQADTLVMRRQSTGTQQIFSPELTMSIRFFRNFFFRPQVIYTQLWRNDDNAIRVPEIFINSQLTYENIFFQKNFQIQLGMDVFYRSSYQAPGYAPDIQTYYNQNNKNVDGYWVSDIFLNAKIKGGRLFVKYHNFFNAFSLTGYMLTYSYPAVGNILDFGFEIPLFD